MDFLLQELSVEEHCVLKSIVKWDAKGKCNSESNSFPIESHSCLS